MTTRASVPPLSLVLGYAPAAILPLCAIAAWMLQPPRLWFAFAAAQIWGSAILIFLAGVRRGLSFRTEGGQRPIQLATMIWLFVLGVGALLVPPLWAFLALMLGYASVALLDPRAAARGEVPDHFARLRPPQMAVAVIGLAALAVRAAGI